LQGDQCTEAAGASLFGAVGIPVVGVTSGANAADFDLPYACMLEGDTIGFPQVEMDLSIV
jgi:hypothetical protein